MLVRPYHVIFQVFYVSICNEHFDQFARNRGKSLLVYNSPDDPRAFLKKKYNIAIVAIFNRPVNIFELENFLVNFWMDHLCLVIHCFLICFLQHLFFCHLNSESTSSILPEKIRGRISTSSISFVVKTDANK